ncbi:S8 family serine peptidase [Fibrella sp. WM1]|uniref:S8 family serine peptidase n=1 Tax=Fibrella musci TaxID=3242485 RepID=UPI003521C9A7
MNAVLGAWAATAQPTARKAVSDYDFGLHGLRATYLRYPGLTGAGLTISIKEQSFDTSDIDFRGRVVLTPATTSRFSDHATTMTTLLGGAGNLISTGRGVATGARLAASSFERLLPDTLPDLRRLGVSVQNHSYGVGIESFYGPEALAYDRQVQQEPTLLHVFSAGNSGTESTTAVLPSPFMTLTGEFKQAKNVLVVGGIGSRGALEARSSRGPTADGRIRPELVAYGNNGTSESAALVSGVGTLLQQTYRNQHGQLPSVAWVRACLLASCQDIGLPGPDHEAGFGSLNALDAVTLAQKRQYQTGTLSTTAVAQSFTLTVPPGMARLAVALAWNDTPVAGRGALRQDLDLWLEPIGTSGGQVRPWVLSPTLHPDSVRLPARRGIDRVNNVEQVSVTQPTPGTYRVWVGANRLPDGPQPYAVAYSIDSAFTWFNPVAGATLMAGELQPIRWLWQGDAGQRGTVSVQLTGETTWQPLADSVRLADQAVWWTTPDRNQTARLRIVTRTRTYLSDEFTLVRSMRPQVLLNCPERAAITWVRQPGVGTYQLYKLGNQYLESTRQTTDTIAFLSPSDGAYVAVWPVIGGKPAQAGYTINYQQQGVGCYISSWLADRLVADTARLNLSLSTTWNLRALTLERATTTDAFTPLQTLPIQPNQREYVFLDRPPVVGAARYRVKLTTQTGETVLTGEETVYGVQTNAPLVFPNPVLAGQPLSVALLDEEVTGTWVSLDGRTLQPVSRSGSLKEVPTEGLPPGLHLLRLDGAKTGRHVIPVLVR